MFGSANTKKFDCYHEKHCDSLLVMGKHRPAKSHKTSSTGLFMENNIPPKMRELKSQQIAKKMDLI